MSANEMTAAVWMKTLPISLVLNADLEDSSE
ncbi:MAG: hypothetical protein ACI8WB_002462 [Phenylobacterium sp.]|jgi:hypothetical protein